MKLTLCPAMSSWMISSTRAVGVGRVGSLTINRTSLASFRNSLRLLRSDRIRQRLANDFGFIADFHFIRLDDAEDTLLVDFGLKLAVFAVRNLKFHYSLPYTMGPRAPDFIHEVFSPTR